MSGRHCCCRKRRDFGIGGVNSCGSGNGLLILILIALQFKNCRRGHHDDDDDCRSGVIDNSILFLITLFFLVCHSNRFTLGCGCDGFGF